MTSTPHFSQMMPRCFIPLVFAADALVVLYRTEDPRAEESVLLRLEGSVVDRLRLLHLSKGPLFYELR